MNINEFMGSINSRGVLQNNRFVVNFELPKALENGGGRYGKDERLMYLRCEAAQIPGVSLTTLDQPRIGYGPLEMMPHNVVQDDVSLTFLVDAHSSIHALFYDWFNTIVNFQGSRGQSTLNTTYKISEKLVGRAFEVGYKDQYRTDIAISVYTSSKNEGGNPVATETGVESMRVKLFNAFPKTMPSVDLAWVNTDELVRMVVPFTYTDFKVYYPRTDKKFPVRIPNGSYNEQATIANEEQLDRYVDPEYSPYSILPDREYD